MGPWQAEIRVEAERLGAQIAGSPVSGHGCLWPIEPERRKYSLYELMAGAEDEFFADTAYRCLLKRSPKAKELREVLDCLDRGESRVVVVIRLRWSTEGRRHRVRVRGLSKRRLLLNLFGLERIGRARRVLDRQAAARLEQVERSAAEDACRLYGRMGGMRREVASFQERLTSVEVELARLRPGQAE